MNYYTYCNKPQFNLFAASCGVGGVVTKNWSTAYSHYSDGGDDGDCGEMAVAFLLDSYTVKISLDKID